MSGGGYVVYYELAVGFGVEEGLGEGRVLSLAEVTGVEFTDEEFDFVGTVGEAFFEFGAVFFE